MTSPDVRESSRITRESMRRILRFASLARASATRSVSTLIEFTKALMTIEENELENIRGRQLPRRSGRQRRKRVHSRRKHTRRGKRTRMAERDRKRKAETGSRRTLRELAKKGSQGTHALLPFPLSLSSLRLPRCCSLCLASPLCCFSALLSLTS